MLIDGRRITASANAFGATVFVHLNRFSPDAIERVEILKDDRSAVDGADAVAGVVNLIARRGPAREPVTFARVHGRPFRKSSAHQRH